MPYIVTPFRFTSYGSVLVTNNVEQVIKQKVIDVLVTSPLERVMRPRYGGNAYGLLFEPLDDLINVDFEAEAIGMLNNNISEGQVVSLSIRSVSSYGAYNDTIDQPGLEITVRYKVPPFDTRQFSFSITNPDLLTEETSL